MDLPLKPYPNLNILLSPVKPQESSQLSGSESTTHSCENVATKLPNTQATVGSTPNRIKHVHWSSEVIEKEPSDEWKARVIKSKQRGLKRKKLREAEQRQIKLLMIAFREERRKQLKLQVDVEQLEDKRQSLKVEIEAGLRGLRKPRPNLIPTRNIMRQFEVNECVSIQIHAVRVLD